MNRVGDDAITLKIKIYIIILGENSRCAYNIYMFFANKKRTKEFLENKKNSENNNGPNE